jgi:hypothetical protein
VDGGSTPGSGFYFATRGHRCDPVGVFVPSLPGVCLAIGNTSDQANGFSRVIESIHENDSMNFRKIAATLFFGMCVNAALAQAPVPALPPEPPAAPPAPAPQPPAPPKPAVVEGALVQSQRSNSDTGKYVWVCTYRVDGTKRSVQLDDSCPSTMLFQLKR